MIKPIYNSEAYEVNSIFDDVESFFSAESPLSNVEELGGGRRYEQRPQQKKMAIEIARCFESSENLCVEAPTGVGKSMAYLVPAIYYAIASSRPVVISTETINLQEQIIHKDIPILQNILDVYFTCALAKGRSNYLCRRRLEMVTGENQSDYLPSNSCLPEIAKIDMWSNNTSSGSISDIGFEPSYSVWRSVCCEHGNCLGPKCKFINGCFYWQARKQWEKADIVVSNHALLLSDLKMKMEGELETGILPSSCSVVIDEAHQLEINAGKHLGTRVSESGIKYFLNRLFNHDNGRGMLLRQGEKAVEIRGIVKTIFDTTTAFFSSVRNKMLDIDKSQLRVQKAYFVDDILTGELAILEKSLREFSKIQEDEDYKLELSLQIERCAVFKMAVFEFLSMNIDNSVFWIEEDGYSVNKSYSLNYSPIDVSEILNKNLFSSNEPVILTSATLAVAKSMKFYVNRVGFFGNQLILGSPYNYNKQVKVYVAKSVREQQHQDYIDTLSTHIKKYIKLTNGKAFVLFTSYKSLMKVKESTKEFFKDNNIRLLVQGENLNRSRMITEFKNDTDSVIFGTTSFWMGVDVPGEALSNVIITKLPFSVPSEPITEAKLELIEESGRNPFMEYSLPEAVIKFKQGIGRLIRSSKDNGIIVILDNRVITKRYGKAFLESIPPCPVIIE